ncbi:unnamed protein product [Coregonus sp. 'balchen']|nr:unnamed protein product [Coregonus sp. 'balchen']
MAFAKIRKVDKENHHNSAKPTCLICMQTAAVIKADNLKRHFNSIHAASFNANYPEKSDQRKQKIASMLTSYKHSVLTMCKITSARERNSCLITRFLEACKS